MPAAVPASSRSAWLIALGILLAGPLTAQEQVQTPRSNEAASDINRPGDHTGSLLHAGSKRLYRVHVPASYSPARPMPLVVAMHGGGGNMDIQAEDKYYGQIAKAERGGFIVVFPNGASRFPRGKLATWNAGQCCGFARDQNSDDVGFIRALIAHLGTQLAIDRQRIFANGMSNGGMMAYRLGCEMPDVFKGIAAVAGTDNTKACAPKAPISVLHIHARDDDHVPFEGGTGVKSLQKIEYVAVADSVLKWVKLNACSPTPKRVLETAGAYCDVYTACRGGVEVKLCVTESGGHSWPGGTKPRGGAAGSSAISASDVIWDFFSTR
jgi:polyhydroxybutyrate depolymerase